MNVQFYKSQEIMRERGIDERNIHATASHGYGVTADIRPEYEMEKVLYAVDELTGLISAIVLMPFYSIIQSSIENNWQDKNMDMMHTKYQKLKDYLKELGSVAVAFSSGVDSTFLLQTAADVLGDKVIAVTASSCSFPKRELEEAERFCAEKGIRHIVVESEELDIKGFRQNPKNRCYLCKRELFTKILSIAEENHISAVAEGSNMDDTGDYRPGMIAVKELGIVSPLRYAELDKEEIRQLSREIGLPTWDKQSFACLSSRFVYGETISEERLHMVDRAEQLLLDMGFHQVRVRIHGEGKGTIARIEVLAEEMPVLMQEENRSRIYAYFKEIGFAYVSLDLGGYRTGSMNETLEIREK